MSDELEPSIKKQRDFAARKRENHRDFRLWIKLSDLEKIERYAVKNGWLNETGRNTGKPNLQKTVSAILKKGLEQIEDEV